MLALVASAAGTERAQARVFASASAASDLWRGDFERGDLSEFSYAPWNHRGAPRPRLSRRHVSQGSYAGFFRLPRGATRSELVGTGPAASFEDGQVRWFAWSVYLPDRFSHSHRWRVLAQWKNEGTGSPPLELAIEDGRWQLGGGWNQGDNRDTSDHRIAWSGPAESGRWTHFVLGVRFQQGTRRHPYQGWVKLWKNGDRVVHRRAFKTLYRGRTSYLKVGLYRDRGIRSSDVVIHDGWRMGRTYSSVAG